MMSKKLLTSANVPRSYPYSKNNPASFGKGDTMYHQNLVFSGACSVFKAE